MKKDDEGCCDSRCSPIFSPYLILVLYILMIYTMLIEKDKVNIKVSINYQLINVTQLLADSVCENFDNKYK